MLTTATTICISYKNHFWITFLTANIAAFSQKCLQNKWTILLKMASLNRAQEIWLRMEQKK